MYIDFHTHSNLKEEKLVSIRNIQQDEKHLVNDSISYSIGLHPWFLTQENYKEDLEWLRNQASEEEVLLIGECGLDRLKGVDLNFQQEVFEQQLLLAEELKKPVVIHCVRAFSELVESKNKTGVTIPLIIHGFNKKESLFKELEKEGFLFSFGAAILNESSPAYQIIQKIDCHSFFLETDAADISIKKIYEQAAFLRNTDSNDILATVLENTKNIGIDV